MYKRQRLSYETIYEDRLVIVLPKKHPAAAYAEKKDTCIYPWLDLSHVAKERFILQHSNQSIRQLEEDALLYSDVLPELTYKISSIDAGIRLAEQGYGVASVSYTHLDVYKRQSSIAAHLPCNSHTMTSLHCKIACCKLRCYRVE